MDAESLRQAGFKVTELNHGRHLRIDDLVDFYPRRSLYRQANSRKKCQVCRDLKHMHEIVDEFRIRRDGYIVIETGGKKPAIDPERVKAFWDQERRRG